MGSAPGRVIVLACACACILAACGPASQPPPPGTLTVSFEPQAVNVANLALSSATLRLRSLIALGDRPPQGPPPPVEVTVTVAPPANASFTFDMPPPPPGVYSRLQFLVEDATIAGTWRSTPFTAHLGMFGGGMVNLFSASGTEVGAGHDGAFTVTVDANAWFAGNLLDTAMVSGGQITCDQSNNPSVAMQLTMRIAQSFAIP